jgi:plastocyanin
MKRYPLLIAVCALAAVLGLAACGGDDNSDNTTAATTDTATTDTTTTEQGAAGGGGTVQVAADPGGALKFVQSSLTAPAGKDTFEFTNDASIPHDFVLEDDGGKEIAKTSVITNDKATTSATLKAGEYTYYCSVPGHRQAGMEGTLTAE